MKKYIYEVCIERGRSHPQHSIFYNNVDALGAKAPDYGGINNMCIISHHMDADTVHLLCSEGIKNKNDVTIEEITKETLRDEFGHHRSHTKIVDKYFLPNGTYPNIK